MGAFYERPATIRTTQTPYAFAADFTSEEVQIVPRQRPADAGGYFGCAQDACKRTPRTALDGVLGNFGLAEMLRMLYNSRLIEVVPVCLSILDEYRESDIELCLSP